MGPRPSRDAGKAVVWLRSDFIITLDAEYCRACGAPVFTIRGHNVEAFVGVVRRYGADAAGVRAIVDAAPARQR
ncbi:putative metallopeptidase [Sinorhizobium meliloti]|uniref:putative metallopeptidase n=1 Tax=Rhizobium meliloti TaxID=382 RepID=UPI001F2AD1E3|nr:putative metallopeptidase [Sinorhizobium meliloti]MCM5690787.1 hypothetical protein [Sinorhizobium meliloti]UIJ91680.1 hypothetical protein LZK74_02010 [Sinorhizobium meliloti]WKL24413.1 putative metallopeptidase [Sinorhizobium meliloti]WKL28416.1 putative metallopeptidase [Sinorhizobium meliloti]WKL33979.1 putative metallopeptidase [Sinorhizobium meliloti]